MSRLSIIAIRCSLIYLVLGWGLGAVLMISKAISGWPVVWMALELHAMMMLFGWFFQLVIGVAYWMLPTFGSRSNRGREWAAWSSVVLVNLGMALGVLAIPWDMGAWLAASCWLLSGLCFGWHAWPRIKAFGRQ